METNRIYVKKKTVFGLIVVLNICKHTTYTGTIEQNEKKRWKAKIKHDEPLAGS